ncbi:3'-5' exonuclease [Stomoxys calcitrans]|uniref:3'-5' exonuclease n=1 Tax=Stomoxys calcitrans TaxID=35570 RepID=A0A1I8P5K7_STOCA|nr:3'-5' exonuclease [Stomoxys calcitrans]
MPRKRNLETATKTPQDEQKSVQDKENEENPPKRRSTRSTRNTRSMVEDGGAVASPEKKKKPLAFVKYRGAIKYFTNGNEIAEASDSLMQFVEKQPGDDLVPISFDMEWPFSFQTGPGKSAVIQMCADEKCCYVFQLTNLKKLPAALVALLKHKRVRLHGVNVKNDFRKLGRDFPEVNSDDLIVNGQDLGTWCNEVCETGGRWSLDRLADYLLDKAIDKNKKVRMSKWHVIPLDENQLMYAAVDVYIGQLMYRELERRAKIKHENETKFIEKNGEEAFKAVKALGENFINEKSDELAI